MANSILKKLGTRLNDQVLDEFQHHVEQEDNLFGLSYDEIQKLN